MTNKAVPHLKKNMEKRTKADKTTFDKDEIYSFFIEADNGHHNDFLRRGCTIYIERNDGDNYKVHCKNRLGRQIWAVNDAKGKKEKCLYHICGTILVDDETYLDFAIGVRDYEFSGARSIEVHFDKIGKYATKPPPGHAQGSGTGGN